MLKWIFLRITVVFAVGLFAAGPVFGESKAGAESGERHDETGTSQTGAMREPGDRRTTEEEHGSMSGNGEKPGRDKMRPDKMRGLQRVSDILDGEVVSVGEEELGEVADLVINPKGEIAYILFSYGGLLGIGDVLVPVPWSEVKMHVPSRANKRANDKQAKRTAVRDQFEDLTLVVNLKEEQLENAPHFSEDDWTRFNDLEWEREVRRYYDEQRLLQKE